MQVVVIATRVDLSTYKVFKTVHCFKHIPVVRAKDVAGWEGSGAGMSYEDYSNLFKLLDDSACNIISLQIELCS